MGTGYVRNDTGNNIADGNVINASDLDGEFDAIVAAFNSSTGHTHDGTSEEGAPITKFGPSQEVEGDATALFPASDGVTDLGKSTKEWKDLYIDGVINTDDMSADAATITGNVSVGGTFSIGGAVSAVSTLKADGDTTLGGELSVSATATFTDNILANADVIIASGMEVGAIATFSALTNFTTNVSVGGTLVVSGDSDIANVSADGTLDVSGNASVGGTLVVTGDTDVTNFSANGTLDVSGNGSVGGTFNVEGDLKNSAGNLTVAATTYIVEVKGGGSTDGQIQLNCSSNSHGQIIKSQDHSAGVTNTMLLPRGASSTLVSEVGTATITNKTLTSPTINGATIDSAVSVSAAGAVNVGTTLAVVGDSDVTNLSANGTFDVSGNASVGGTLAVTGDADVTNVSANGTLDVSGNASVGGTFNVTGSAGLSGNVNIGNATADVATISSQVEFQNNLRERTSINSTSATGTINFDVLSHNVEIRTSDAAANFELNIRGDSSSSLDSVMSTGETTSIAFESSQGGTAYYLDAIQIDGSTATPVYWQGGTAPSQGNASGYDSYLINVTKTGSAAFTCLASQTQYGKVTY
jgi:cytoskeletal protein CcmA (bactofilin family)